MKKAFLALLAALYFSTLAFAYNENLSPVGVTYLQLFQGTTAPIEAQNSTLINNAIAIASANASTSVGAPQIVISAGDYYFSAPIVPMSNVTLNPAGPVTLHYAGVGNAVENSSTVPLFGFSWNGLGLDQGAGAGGVILHSPWGNHWRFAGAAAANAAGTFFGLLADIAGSNAAFNHVDDIILTPASVIGTGFYISGTGSPTVPTAIATLNTIGDIYVPSFAVGGAVVGHWADTNSWVGQQNYVVGANNGVCLTFNNSSDATKTVYNNTMGHVSCAQYTSLTGTVAVKLGYTRTINIDALYLDENVSTPFATPLSTSSAGTSSYRIVVHGNDPFGSEQIRVWQQYIEYSGGPGVSLAQSLPIIFNQVWANVAVLFTAFNFDVTDNGSATNSTILNVSVNGVSKANIDKNGNINATGGMTLAGTVAASGLSVAAPLISNGVPSILSGFGVGAAVSWNNGPSLFDVYVGTGGTAQTGTITLPAGAINGLGCDAADVTTSNATVFVTKVTGANLTSIILTNFSNAGIAAPWASGDHLRVRCFSG